MGHGDANRNPAILGVQRFGSDAECRSAIVRGGVYWRSPAIRGRTIGSSATATSAAGAGVILDSTAAGNYINFLVPDVSARKYDVRVGVKTINTRGIFQMAIGQAGNNSPTNTGAPQDLYSASAAYVELDLGAWTPATNSDKWFWITVTGKNASSTGYTLAFDYILLLPE